jgi:serine/threonine protein kinase
LKIHVGTVLNERYQILQELGEGGFAHVYRAYDRMLDRELAIKVIKQQCLTDGDLPRFEREAKLLAQLKHENIVAVYSFNPGDSASLPFIVMEYMRGQSLRAYLNEHKLSTPQLFSLVQQLCEGLGYAHNAGVIHRDLSPANIFVMEEAQNNLSLKILDFGLSRLFGPSNLPMKTLTEQGMMLGNPRYMSPELIIGESVDNRADIYALGCIIYECISGQFAFNADTPVGLFFLHEHEYPQVPLSEKERDDLLIRSIALRCLQKNPKMRFQSCQEIIDVLKEPELQRKWPELDGWADEASSKRKSTEPNLKAAFMAIVIGMTLIFLCLCASSMVPHIITSFPVATAIEQPLADALFSAKRFDSARKLYAHLDTEYSKSSSKFQDSFDCRYKQAESYLLAGDQNKFVELTESALAATKECPDKRLRLTLVNKLWELVNQSETRMRNNTAATRIQKELFVEMMAIEKDGPASRRAFDAILLNLLKTRQQLPDADIKALCDSLAKYVANARRPLSAEECRLLEQLCTDPTMVYVNSLWLARMNNSRITREDFIHLKVMYAKHIAKENPQLAIKYLEESVRASSHALTNSLALSVEADTYYNLGQFENCVKSCDRGLTLNDGDQKQLSVRKIDLLSAKAKALQKLNRIPSFMKCIAKMKELLDKDLQNYDSDASEKTGLLPDRSNFDLSLFMVKYGMLLSCLNDTRQYQLLTQTINELTGICKNLELELLPELKFLLQKLIRESDQSDLRAASQRLLKESEKHKHG